MRRQPAFTPRRHSQILCGVLVAIGSMHLHCSSRPDSPAERAHSPSATGPKPLFLDVTDAAEIDFRHINGKTARKYLPEIMGSGGCALDYDGDGSLDIYLVQSGPIADTNAGRPLNRLFRNRGDGTFEDVSAGSGLEHSGYGMGAVAADYDNDGDTDIYLLNFGPDALFRNNGDGTYRDVTREAGVHNASWGSSAAFLDADLDGDLDLYVVNYLDFTLGKHIDCGTPLEGVISYCHPDVYEMSPDVFFRNRGDGTFEEATGAAGLTDRDGKGLGVVVLDFDGDGWPDIHVANDSTPNFLYRNKGDGTFEEVGLFMGVGYNEDGLTEAGMGNDAGDVNGDGSLDLFVTNLSAETNALLLGGAREFKHSTRDSGLFGPSYLPVGFGTELGDFDNDGDLDIVVTNGHVIDNVELIDDSQTFRQPSQVFLNDGRGRFSELDPGRTGDLSKKRVGRGTIQFDYDNDGRLDILITFNNDRARLFRNVGASESWIGFVLQGTGTNRDAVGARVTLTAGGKILMREKKSGSSYQTSGDTRLHFGLGGAKLARQVAVRWPGGTDQAMGDLAPNRYYRAEEGAAAQPLPNNE